MNVQHARAYCAALGLNADEEVWGYFGRTWTKLPRWRWYLGAHPSLADGATELSPKQVRLRSEGRGR